MLYSFIIVIHVLLGLGIVGLVLMQQGKGADAGAAFGSGSSGSVFGAQGSASFLSKTTAVFAALFFTTSLGLAVMGGHHVKKTDLIESISVDETKPAAPADVPVVPSDVPLSPVKAGEDAAPIEKLPQAAVPAEPALKTVEPAPATQPKAE